jgi:lysophospholipase L1-like esterase
MNKPIFYRLFSNTALVIGSLFFLCLTFEIALRIANYNPFGEFFESEGPAVFIQPSKNPRRIFEARPGANGYGWGTHISINQAGFRGRDYLLPKPEDTYRVVVIGDSVAFGNNLPEDKNYPALLERLFAESQQHVEVLNLALGGYDTLQEVATLEEIGLQFSPDLVILGYCINDIGIASGNLNYIKRLKNYGSPVYRSRLAQFIRVQLDRVELIQYNKSANNRENFDSIYKNMQADISHDAALGEKMQRLSTLLDALPVEKKPGYFFTRDYTQTSRMQRLRFALEQLKSLQQKNTFQVLVLFTPYLIEDKTSQPIYQAVYAIIEHEIKRQDFPSLNLYQRFADAGFDKIILKKNDGVHPNLQGHEIIASELYQLISTQ